MNDAGRDLLLACGVGGPPLFVAVFLLEGGTRAGYDARRHPVSSLAIGDRGWRQTANFLLGGAAVVASACGARLALRGTPEETTWGPRLLGLAGVGLVGAGMFATDPIFGYPPEAPFAFNQSSARGHLHNLFSLCLFAGLPAACLVFARGFARAGKPGWATYALLTALAMPATFVLAGAGFRQDPRFAANAGGFQRLAIATGLGWVALNAARMRRAARR